MRLFVGTEVEGVQRGAKTLFVSGPVPFNIIEEEYNKLSKRYKYLNIYFGADDRSTIDWDVVKKVCKEIAMSGSIYAEVGNFDEQLNAVPPSCLNVMWFHLVVFGYNKLLKRIKFLRGNVHIKVESNKHYLITDLSSMEISAVDDPLYKHDKTVWKMTFNKAGIL